MGAINIDIIKWNIKELKSQAMRLYFSCLPLATMRMRFLRRHKIFAELGDNVHFQPRHYPVDADRIKIHNNVAIATNVTFYLHDISWMVLEKLSPPRKNKSFIGMKGCCEIYDNVFIGANATILYDVTIGPNAIVAAGAVVTKDVLPGTVVAGVPAKVIGEFDDFVAKRAVYGEEYRGLAANERNEKEWENFYMTHPKL